MEKKSDQTINKRARSNEQKTARREAILNSAGKHLAEVGIEKFSMGVLAKEVGIARTTLYLYFDTREALMLTLYSQHLENWCELMEQTLPGPVDDETFLTTFWQTSRVEPQLILLGSKLGMVIEHNVSMEHLQASKIKLYEIQERIKRHFSKVLVLDEPTASAVSLGLGTISMGLNQLCSGPKVDPEGLPEGVIEMAKAFQEPAIIFQMLGSVLLKGART